MKPARCEIPLKASFTDPQIRAAFPSGETDSLLALGSYRTSRTAAQLMADGATISTAAEGRQSEIM